MQVIANRLLGAILLACACAGWAQAQDSASPALATSSSLGTTLLRRPAGNPASRETILLTVPTGTAVQVVLDKEVRIEKVGQPICGHVVQPVYAFDRLVIPVGSQVVGQITKIDRISGSKRAIEAFDADFTPARKIEIEFNTLSLPDGKHIAVQTAVTPGSGQVIQFVSASGSQNQKKGVKDAASEKTSEVKRQAKQEWSNALKDVKEPGKFHRIERYVVAQLPVHPQYIDAGTVYFAELQHPIDFGTEPLTPELASSLGASPSDGSVVHARLSTPLNSATARKGDDVEAAVSQPLFDGGRLILPQGSRLRGSVVQVQPARRMSHNGQLRFVFHEVVLPDGVEQNVEAVLNGVEATKADNLKLDSEGGAQATTPKTRYLKTAISVGMAAVSGRGDPDAKIANPAGNPANRAIGGAGGFKLVGMVLGALVRSRAFGYSMGAYGAGMSVYTHFIARGREVVFPKNTAMEIGLGTRPSNASPDATLPAAGDPAKQ
ncbi:MAG TPA: hypothetical protein VNE63_04490 [Candidatus Acidoferrales bacterium]|nr:hypothetical protein [Candidatus Acidoferrales bacterium]